MAQFDISQDIKIVHITSVPETLGFFSGQPEYFEKQKIYMHAITSPGPIWTNPNIEREFKSITRIMISRKITPLKDIYSLFKILIALWALKPNIVDAHTPKAGLLSMLAAWILRIPIRIYHIHGFPFETSKGIKRQLMKQVERISCLCSTQIICVSPSLVVTTSREKISNIKKVKVLGYGSINGIDLNKFNPNKYSEKDKMALKNKLLIPSNVKIVGFVGRLVRDKGIEDLAEAWKIVQKNNENIHLLLIGPHEERDTISIETKKYLSSELSIHLLSSTSDIPRFYSIMDLLVLPSYREGLPYVPLEAAAMQLPVVVTSVTGCVDVICAGETGLLIPPGEPLALADAILTYIHDPEKRKQHGQAGRKFIAEHFNQEKVWEGLCYEYNRLIKQSMHNDFKAWH